MNRSQTRSSTSENGKLIKTPPTPTLQGVSRALRVLDLLAERPMRTSELSAELEVSWATLQRTMVQLESDGFITRNQAGLFRIGLKTWLLGSTYLVGHPLLELAIPLLSRASSEIPHAVLQLVERTAGSSVVLFSKEAVSAEVITRTTYGYHFPLHCGSKGWVLLAWENAEFIEDYLSGRLLSLTLGTVTDPDELRRRLDQVRREGYAVTIGDVQTFTGSVAAPIRDASGTVVACVTAISQRSAMGGDKEDRLTEVVLRLAQALSLGNGWQPLHHAKAAAD